MDDKKYLSIPAEEVDMRLNQIPQLVSHLAEKASQNDLLGLSGSVDSRFNSSTSQINEKLVGLTKRVLERTFKTSGDNYIDLGLPVVDSENWYWELICKFHDLNPVSPATSQNVGARDANGNFYWGVNNQKWYFYYKGKTLNTIPADTDYHKFKLTGDGKLYIDNELIYDLSDATGGLPTANLYLFARNYSPKNHANMTISSSTVYNNGLAQELVFSKEGSTVLDLLTGSELTINGTINGDAWNLTPTYVLKSSDYIEVESGSGEGGGSVPVTTYDLVDDRQGFVFSQLIDRGGSGSYLSDMTFVGDELWTFSKSNDEHTDYAKVQRFEVDIKNEKLTLLGSFEHNFGHANSVDYCEETDTLIMGNGSGSYTLTGQIYIFENASSFKDMSRVEFNDHALVIDIAYLNWGAKTNVVWGESNRGKHNIAYVINNDNKNIRKILLGQGSNQLSEGQFVSGKSSSQFNGTFEILKEYSQTDGDEVNQGTYFAFNKLWIGLGHGGLWCSVNKLNDDGTISKEVFKEPFYNDSGVQDTRNMNGLVIKGGYLFMGFTGSFDEFTIAQNEILVYKL